MIDRDPFGDGVQEHRLAGACRGDDEGALTVAHRSDKVDGATGELGPSLGRATGLQR
ncbi:MAG: hypothetical protein IPF47_24265 [Gemmatimonadetes bacterium]|jgi:hypothetical protein|nr:hypothetical protein [Gemmatimonadota bacterium]